jgi:hypothetical protein
LGFSDSSMQTPRALSAVNAISGSGSDGRDSVEGGSNSAAAMPAIASTPSQSMAAGVREEAGNFGGVVMSMPESGTIAAHALVVLVAAFVQSRKPEAIRSITDAG